jgi:hypothetical protein
LKKKDYNYIITDSPPLSVIQQLVSEEIEEFVIFQKVLRSLPMRFNPKILALEERSDLNSISMDELHGIFTAYEMRTEQENQDVKEAAFKASKRSKQKKKEQEEYSSSNDISEDDEEVVLRQKTEQGNQW